MPGPHGSRRSLDLLARGQPWVWVTAGGIATALLMILGLLVLVLVNGLTAYWPGRVTRIRLDDGATLLGEVARSEPGRKLVRTGNYDLTGKDFQWVEDARIAAEDRPADAWVFERLEWGRFYGTLREVRLDGQPAGPTREKFRELHRTARARSAEIRRIERNELGAVFAGMERLRLAVRKAELRHGADSPAGEAARREAREREPALEQESAALNRRLEELKREDARATVVLADATGREKLQRISEIVRAYPANELGPAGRLGVYGSRWWEFLTAEPREFNTEGGIFPAIFGTVLMTLIMSVVIVPFGVIAALYLREYARQGPLVSAVRIAVNNLAGVPSIVFGIFGLGFFCYLVGGRIDALFYSEKLPAPTFGTQGLLWASLTLALLTVPVVIVATEEALAAVPQSLREGSYGCGASRWQTIRRIVLPKAMPGIMTGLILAMARGAGEVAPLMLTGVVKLAGLPVDGTFPFLHLERSFMHLGFHIYDVGFQSRNSEAGKPTVFVTTLVLILVVAVLNLTAIWIRGRLRRRYGSERF
jgi:phosphate transport system permease protein